MQLQCHRTCSTKNNFEIYKGVENKTNIHKKRVEE